MAKPIINTHTHIFNSSDVPNHIAKKFIPWPLYWITDLRLILPIYRLWRNHLKKPLRNLIKQRNRILAYVNAMAMTKYLFIIALVVMLINIVFALLHLFDQPTPVFSWEKLNILIEWLHTNVVFMAGISKMGLIGVIALVSFLSKYASQLIWKLLTSLSGLKHLLPKGNWYAFFARYLHIVKFANYKYQSGIYQRLYKMYPGGSEFVVLPMDMEHMEAGSTKRPYLEQLYNLRQMKRKANETNKQALLIPFIFADPRRFTDSKNCRKAGCLIIKAKEKFKIKQKTLLTIDKSYFDWEWDPQNELVVLKDSWMKDYLASRKDDFRGVKIYPALGYYPFDEKLLPLWLYCVQNNIPITTHCIDGTIFYRGKMKTEWFEHPVFKEDGVPLDTSVRSNYDLQRNFTHPLNYIVLLEPSLLREHISKNVTDKDVQTIFGFDKNNPKLKRDLSSLKINLAHYGGSQEWINYWENDRQEASQEIEEVPEVGLEFIPKKQDDGYIDTINWGRLAWMWSSKVDWYTLISSMMIQYDNVYADISYTLHNQSIMPLLKRTMENKALAPKVLFGTDFYVVRNHKSEKQLFAEINAQLGKEMMQLIAVDNPETFLRREWLEEEAADVV